MVSFSQVLYVRQNQRQQNIMFIAHITLRLTKLDVTINFRAYTTSKDMFQGFRVPAFVLQSVLHTVSRNFSTFGTRPKNRNAL